MGHLYDTKYSYLMKLLYGFKYSYLIVIIIWFPMIISSNNGPVGWSCRIHRLHFSSNECPRYDNKQSDGEAPVRLKLWGMWSTLSLPLLLGPLRPGVVAPDRVLSIGQIELNCVLKQNWIVWKRTVFDFYTAYLC